MLRYLNAAANSLSRRTAWLLITTIFALVPLPAFAVEGGTPIHLANDDRAFLIGALVAGLVALAVASILLRPTVLSASPGSDKMQEVGKAIREGALAYLTKQISTMKWFIAAIAVGLVLLFMGSLGFGVAAGMAVCFILGVSASYCAGFSGMLMAVEGNMRTAHAALSSYKASLEVAFRAGSVTGLMTVGLGLSIASLILLFGGQSSMHLLVGFGFGGSLAALFMRVGGGIFTKAADVGADLVGKIEAGIPEDDPRNPATIADNVGDNVGDCAGMAADVFESYAVMLVASIVLAAATSEVFDQHTWMRLLVSALVVSAIGIVASIIGVYAVRGVESIEVDPLKIIRKGFLVATGISVVGTLIYAFFALGGFADLRKPTTGFTVQTSALVSIDQLEHDEFQSITDVRTAVAQKSGKATYEVTADDLAKEPAVRQLVLGKAGAEAEKSDPVLSAQNDAEVKSAIQQALGQKVSQMPPAPDLRNYRPIDWSSKSDPILEYGTADISTDANQTPSYKSLRDVYSVEVNPTTHERKQTDLRVLDVQVKMFKPDSTGKIPPPQTAVVGPYPYDAVMAQIKKSNDTGQGLISVVNTYPATFYENATDGKVAIAVDGDFNPLALKRQSVSYATSSPGDIDRAHAAQLANPSAGAPDMEQTTVGFITHHHVPWYLFVLTIVFGIVLAFAIEQLTDYYVSTHRKPAQEVARATGAGSAPMILQGFSYGLESSVFMVLAIVLALLVPLWVFPPAAFNGSFIPSFFGVALVGIGLLTTTGFLLAMDTFGPISDNAQGVFEMSGAGHTSPSGSLIVARLDAAGNTTKALTKGFAITTAVIAAVALFHSYLADTNLGVIGLRLDYPQIFLGLLIGGAAPYLFSAFSINAVGRAALELINEVRRQFKADPGIMAGTSKPNYGVCVAIVTAAAQRELMSPGILAIALPLAVGFGFSIGQPLTMIGAHGYNLAGAEALGGFLAGAILSGQLMAVLLANSGGIWDNAKKIVEDGMHGGKGTEAHKASVVGDTVGDPFKDTAGPALNPLIKVMNLVALLTAPIIIRPFGNWTLFGITLVCVVALAISLYYAKKGSMSDEF
jgi:K(+)-stimulated pyrophosphate-energized sodium pump